MKKILLYFLLPILLFSCNTLKNPSNGKIALLLIPHKAEKEAGVKTPGNFMYIIKAVNTNYTATITLPVSNGFKKIYLEPGIYKITEIGHREKSGFVSNIKNHDIEDLFFEVFNGYISVLPIVFTTEVVTKNIKSMYFNWTYSPITNKIYKDAVNSIDQSSGYDKWELTRFNSK